VFLIYLDIFSEILVLSFSDTFIKKTIIPSVNILEELYEQNIFFTQIIIIRSMCLIIFILKLN